MKRFAFEVLPVLAAGAVFGKLQLVSLAMLLAVLAVLLTVNRWKPVAPSWATLPVGLWGIVFLSWMGTLALRHEPLLPAAPNLLYAGLPASVLMSYCTERLYRWAERVGYLLDELERER